MEDRADHMGKRIRDTAHMIKHRMNSFVGHPELNSLQIRIREYIKLMNRAGTDVYRGDIEREYKISRPSVTSVLNTMEKNGYIRRMPVPGDARKKKLVLTDKALQTEREMYSRIIEFEKILIAGFSRQETERLKAGLDKIIKNIESIKRC